MPTTLPQPRLTGWRAVHDGLRKRARWDIAAFGVPAVAIGLAATLPAPLMLPALSLLLLAAGFGLAAVNAVAARRARMSRHLAGALVFFGFAASLMSDPEPVLQALAELDAALSGAPPAE
jgi:hypothetical protein